MQVDLRCDKGKVRLSLNWKDKQCAADFQLSAADLKRIQQQVSGVQVCEVFEAANPDPPKVLKESAVQFAQSCPADGPSEMEGPGGPNIVVYRHEKWPYGQSGKAYRFSSGQRPLLDTLRALAEPKLSGDCPDNGLELFQP